MLEKIKKFGKEHGIFLLHETLIFCILIWMIMIFFNIESPTLENYIMASLWLIVIVVWIVFLPILHFKAIKEEATGINQEPMESLGQFLKRLKKEAKGFIFWSVLSMSFLYWTFNTKYAFMEIIYPTFFLLFVISSYLIAKDTLESEGDHAIIFFTFIIGIIMWFAFVGEVWIRERNWNNYSNFNVFATPSYALIISFPLYFILKLIKRKFAKVR